MSPTDLPHEAHLAAIACLDGVGPARLRWLLGLGAPHQVWERICAGRLPAGPGGPAAVDAGLRTRWQQQSSSLSPAQVWQRCDDAGIGVVALGGAGYPPSLAEDPEPPVVLFHRGDPDLLGGPRVAVIGTRRATGYGRHNAYYEAAANRVCLLLQLESAEALRNLEAICAVEGVDGLFVGPVDLATDMGHLAQPLHPEVVKAATDAMGRIRAGGKGAGILAGEAQAQAYLDAGATMVCLGSDLGLLVKTADALASRWVKK